VPQHFQILGCFPTYWSFKDLPSLLAMTVLPLWLNSGCENQVLEFHGDLFPLSNITSVSGMYHNSGNATLAKLMCLS